MSLWNFNNRNNRRPGNDNNSCCQNDCKDIKRDCDCDCQKDPCGFDCCNCPPGPQGPAGGVLNFADFYALMPHDNTATVAPGTDVNFPQDGPSSGSDISRAGTDSFNLVQIGTYQILFEVGVDEAGQWILTLNGEDLAYTVVGRATGASQIG